MYQSIFNNSAVSMAVADPQGRFIEVNPATCTLFGYSEQELLNMTVTNDIWKAIREDGSPFPPDEHPSMVTLKSGQPCHDVIMGIERANNGLTWLSVNSQPMIRPGETKPYSVVITFSDITKRRENEEFLQQLIEKMKTVNAQLLQSEKMASLGQLAAGVAHEINNPVGFVSSNLSTLTTYFDDLLKILDCYAEVEPLLTEQPDVLNRIQKIKDELELDYLRQDIQDTITESKEGTNRVKQIVQDLKDFSRSDEDDEWQWADLHQGIDSTLNIARNEIKYRANVIKEFGDLPQVECIPAQLNQVIMNLLINAANAIENQGTITLLTGYNDKSKNVWVEVRDTGKGIAQEHIERIFDPFFTTKPVGQGTGLGLSLSYGIIDKHHGTLTVNSEPGKGSTFRITLPIQRVEQQPHNG